jgi:hypothetical protein
MQPGLVGKGARLRHKARTQRHPVEDIVEHGATPVRVGQSPSVTPVSKALR